MILSSELRMGFIRMELPIIPISVIKLTISTNPSPGILMPVILYNWFSSSPSTNSKETTRA